MPSWKYRWEAYFRTLARRESTVQITSADASRLEITGGFSVIVAERVLGLARSLGVWQQWENLQVGNVTKRCTSYTPDQRIAALIAGLACGLRGIAPGNRLLRSSSAIRGHLGERFPDQGTIHRWLQQVTGLQAAALRRHLHSVVREHGRFHQELWSDRMLYVDIDGQGLVARGQRFERASVGYMDDGLDRGFQRYVAYAGETHEVLDELLVSGGQNLLVVLSEIVSGLNEIFMREERGHVVLRTDSHGCSVKNIRLMRSAGYHYLCPLYGHKAMERIKEHVQGLRANWFQYTDSKGQVHKIRYWVVRNWQLRDHRHKHTVRTHATLYHDAASVQRPWTALVSDLKRHIGRRGWEHYHERSGTIEEYNDQSERAYHLDVMRSGNHDGLNIVHTLVALCWNLTRWATEELVLPPSYAPSTDGEYWLPAGNLDMSQLLERAAHSGLRLYRAGPRAILEVENTAHAPESRAWLAWLHRPTQQRLRLTG